MATENDYKYIDLSTNRDYGKAHLERARSLYRLIQRLSIGATLTPIENNWISFALGMAYRVECDLAEAAMKKEAGAPARSITAKSNPVLSTRDRRQTAELARAVLEFATVSEEAGTKLSIKELADRLGLDLMYTEHMLRVMKNVKPEITSRWAKAENPLPLQSMLTLCMAIDQELAYNELEAEANQSPLPYGAFLSDKG